MPNFSSPRTRGVVVLAAAGMLAVSAGSGAVAGSMITGKDIKNRSIEARDLARGSVTSNKVKNGTLKLKDMSSDVTSKLGVQGPAGPAGPKGPEGAQGPKGMSGLEGAVYRTMTYANGGGGSATVACADTEAESQKYTAISGGVQGGTVDTQGDGFAINSSFPGRMNWDAGVPKEGRLDGWIILGNAEYTSTLTVWALCVPTTSIPVDADTIQN